MIQYLRYSGVSLYIPGQEGASVTTTSIRELEVDERGTPKVGYGG